MDQFAAVKVSVPPDATDRPVAPLARVVVTVTGPDGCPESFTPYDAVLPCWTVSAAGLATTGGPLRTCTPTGVDSAVAPAAGLVSATVGALCAPVQVVPFSANDEGVAPVPVKLAPMVVLAPVASAPFRLRFLTVTSLPDWLQSPLQPCVSVWSPV